MNGRRRIYSLVLLALLFACSSSAYQYYGLDLNGVANIDRGTLLAKEEKDDKPLTVCLPQPGRKSPCVVMDSKEFFKAMRDIEELKARLKACEKNS